MAIRFFLHLVDYKIKGKKKIKTWIKKILSDHEGLVGKINIIITSDSELLKINRKYLKRTNYTDIITFDFSNQDEISGELYISIDRIKENAEIFKVSYQNELLRIIVHGILHLIGYNDIESAEKIKMRKMEDYYIEIYYKRESENI